MLSESNIQIIGSLSKGLKTIDIIYNKGEIGATELGELLNINKSSAYRILLTLEQNGYVYQNTDGGKWRLGLKLAKFQSKVLGSFEIREIAHPFLVEVSKITKESSGLSVFSEKHSVVIIDKCNSPLHIGAKVSLGTEEEINCTAHGKALLYSLPKDEQRKLLEGKVFKKHTPKTLVTIDDILADAEKNKEKGYAVDDEENTIGMRCIATNVYDFNGKCVAAIGISCPSERVRENEIPVVAQEICNVAKKLSKRLGY